MPASALEELIELSRRLGDPANDYVILGEGNVSTREDDESFWVKASGAELRRADPSGFVRVRFAPVLSMLSAEALDDAEIKRRLVEAKVEKAAPGHPSVETLLHAVCLGLDGVRFVAHTHPTAINAVTCSRRFDELTGVRLFPDQVVVCGPHPVRVPYRDPGVPLAREVGQRLREAAARHGELPRALYLQNHGFLALGGSPRQVEGITAMATKAARVLAGAEALGGAWAMTDEAVARIHTRPDEHLRQRVLGHR